MCGRQMETISIDNLIHQLEVFLREYPDWQDADVVFAANYILFKKGKEFHLIDCKAQPVDL